VRGQNLLYGDRRKLIATDRRDGSIDNLRQEVSRKMSLLRKAVVSRSWGLEEASRFPAPAKQAELRFDIGSEEREQIELDAIKLIEGNKRAFRELQEIRPQLVKRYLAGKSKEA
jgi:hypothetical protein